MVRCSLFLDPGVRHFVEAIVCGRGRVVSSTVAETGTMERNDPGEFANDAEASVRVCPWCALSTGRSSGHEVRG